MKSHKKFLLSSVTLAVLTLMNQAQAAGQATADAPAVAATPAAAPKDAVAAEVQQVVVTGTSSGSKRKIDTSFSITTASEEQIKEAAPSSTGDLLKIVPGIMAESTGGQSGANIDVRGFPSGSDSPFVTIQMNGSPVYPVSTLNFMEGTSLFRIDDTVERVEVLRGGPSPIFADGQVGATVNFVLKKGGDTPEGSIRETIGTGKLRRTDLFFSGKISDGWYGSIGGFYRTDDGVRNTQFPADDGGQLTATITKKLDQGELTVYARSVNDKNAFYQNVPLMASGSGQGVKLTGFPGIDPLTWTEHSDAIRNFKIEVGPGQFITKDLADGRGLVATSFGADFDQKINGWSVSNKANYFSGEVDTNALWVGPVPQTLGAYVAGLATANGATGGVATYVQGGATVDPATMIQIPTIWSVTKALRSFTDEVRVSKEIVKGNTLTAGAYLASYSSKDRWYLGNGVLMTAAANSQPIALTLNNGVAVTTAGGLASGPFNQTSTANNGRDNALYVADEWKVNEAVSVDAGFRRESTTKDISYELAATNPDLSGNPKILYDKNVAVLTGVTNSMHVTQSATSYTAGGNFKVSKDFSVFARINSGAAFPDVDTIRNGGTNTPPVEGVKQYEVGVKAVSPLYSLYLTAFKADFTGLSFLRITPTGNIITQFGSKGHGLEFDGAVRPFQNFQVALSGAYVSSKYNGNPSIEGNTVTRQPKLQYRVTPSYRINMGNASVKLYGTYNYVGDRWNDQANTQGLPKYSTVDAGVLVELGDNFEFRLSGTNLGNALATTEGNNQSSAATVTGPVYGRPLFGRAVEASIMYHF